MRVFELLTNFGGSETWWTLFVEEEVATERPLPKAKFAITPRTGPPLLCCCGSCPFVCNEAMQGLFEHVILDRVWKMINKLKDNVYLCTWNGQEFCLVFFFPFMNELSLLPTQSTFILNSGL